MRKVFMWKTSDGRIFECPKAARLHALARYQEYLTQLSDEAVVIDRGYKMTAWIESNAGRFVTLQELKEDADRIHDTTERDDR